MLTIAPPPCFTIWSNSYFMHSQTPFRLVLMTWSQSFSVDSPVSYYHTHTSQYPYIDMWEEKNELVMKVELPGVKKEDIDVSLQGDCLTIKAERKQEELPEDSTSYICERCFGRFSRSVSLPFPVNADKINTTFENGVLEIRLPKTEEAKAKHIAIQAGPRKAVTSRSK